VREGSEGAIKAIFGRGVADEVFGGAGGESVPAEMSWVNSEADCSECGFGVRENESASELASRGCCCWRLSCWRDSKVAGALLALQKRADVREGKIGKVASRASV